MHTALLSRFDIIMYIDSTISFDDKFEIMMSDFEVQSDTPFNKEFYNKFVYSLRKIEVGMSDNTKSILNI